MAYFSKPGLVMLVLFLSTIMQVSDVRRIVPASSDKKQTECFDHKGTVLILGIGRYVIGNQDNPNITGLENSGRWLGCTSQPIST